METGKEIEVYELGRGHKTTKLRRIDWKTRQEFIKVADKINVLKSIAFMWTHSPLEGTVERRSQFTIAVKRQSTKE